MDDELNEPLGGPSCVGCQTRDSQLQQLIAKYKKQQTKNATLKQQLEQANAALVQAQQSSSSSSASATPTPSGPSPAEYKALQLDLTAAQKKLRQQELDIDHNKQQLQTQSKKISKLQEALAEKEKELQAKATKAASASAGWFGGWTGSGAEQAKKEEQFKLLQTNHETLEKQFQLQLQSLAEIGTLNDELKKKNKLFLEERDEAKKNEAQQRDQANSLQTSLTEAQTLINQQKKELHDFQLRLQLANAQYDELNVDHRQLEQNHSALNHEHSQLMQRSEEEHDEFMTVKNQLSLAQQSLQSLTHQYEEKEKELFDAQQQLEEMHGVLEPLHQQLADIEQENLRLQGEVASAWSSDHTHTNHPRRRSSHSSLIERTGDDQPPSPPPAVLTLDEVIQSQDSHTTNQHPPSLTTLTAEEDAAAGVIVQPFEDESAVLEFENDSSAFLNSTAADWLEQAKQFQNLVQTIQSQKIRRGRGRPAAPPSSSSYSISYGTNISIAPSASDLLLDECLESDDSKPSSSPIAPSAASSTGGILSTPIRFVSSLGGLFSPPVMQHVSPIMPPSLDESITTEADSKPSLTTAAAPSSSAATISSWQLHQHYSRLHEASAQLRILLPRLIALQQLASSQSAQLFQSQRLSSMRQEQTRLAQETARAALDKVREVQMLRSQRELEHKEIVDEMGEKIHELTTKLLNHDL